MSSFADKLKAGGPPPAPPRKTFMATVASTKTPYHREFQDATDRGNAPRTRSHSFGSIQATVRAPIFLDTLTEMPGHRATTYKRVDRVHVHDRPQGVGATPKPDSTVAPGRGTVVDPSGSLRSSTMGSISKRSTY